jgi:hypothetical protein
MVFGIKTRLCLEDDNLFSLGFGLDLEMSEVARNSPTADQERIETVHKLLLLCEDHIQPALHGVSLWVGVKLEDSNACI